MFVISKSGIFRILENILIEQLKQLRNYSFYDINLKHNEKLTNEGLGLDSVELLNIASIVNQVFCLYESNTEEYLLRYKSLDEWCKIINETMKKSFRHMSFYTSGTTGEKKVCRHSIENLLQEVKLLKMIIGDINRILYAVPSHHLYGFIFTVLMPEYFNIQAVDIRKLSIYNLLGILDNNDLIVSIPTYWRYIQKSINNFPPSKKVLGISSTSLFDGRLIQSLIEKGLDTMFEIYGSSETSGVAYRVYPNKEYRLFDYWNNHHTDDKLIMRTKENGKIETYELMDNIIWHDDFRFSLKGRKDKVIQIGGNNISLEHIKAVVCENDLVEDCFLSLIRVDGEDRLKATISVKNNVYINDITKNNIKTWMSNKLSGIEIPKCISYTKQY